MAGSPVLYPPRRLRDKSAITETTAKSVQMGSRLGKRLKLMDPAHREEAEVSVTKVGSSGSNTIVGRPGSYGDDGVYRGGSLPVPVRSSDVATVSQSVEHSDERELTSGGREPLGTVLSDMESECSGSDCSEHGEDLLPAYSKRKPALELRRHRDLDTTSGDAPKHTSDSHSRDTERHVH